MWFTFCCFRGIENVTATYQSIANARWSLYDFTVAAVVYCITLAWWILMFRPQNRLSCWSAQCMLLVFEALRNIKVLHNSSFLYSFLFFIVVIASLWGLWEPHFIVITEQHFTECYSSVLSYFHLPSVACNLLMPWCAASGCLSSVFISLH